VRSEPTELITRVKYRLSEILSTPFAFKGGCKDMGTLFNYASIERKKFVFFSITFEAYKAHHRCQQTPF
jgi:hypothetical protein